MEGQQTPLPILEDSGTPKKHISSDHRSPTVDAAVNPQEVFVSPPASNNGSPNEIVAEVMEEDDVDKEFFDSLPPGYRFCPTDSDLIVHYLQKKIINDKLPRNQIRHVNLYQHSPEEISERYPPVGEKEWYFFTPRDRKYRNGTRPNRAAGSGYWKATGADKPITHRSSRVGFRKALVYYEGKPPKGLKTNWIMHEYRVDGSPRPKTSSTDMRLDDFVLCRIYKKIDKSFKTRPRNEDPETIDQDGYQAEKFERFDQRNNAYLSDVDNKDGIHPQIFDKDFKELEASADLMQSQFNNGFRDIHRAMDVTSLARSNNGFRNIHPVMEATSFAAKFCGNFSPLSYASKPLYLRPPESILTSKYLNESSLEVKPRGMHDNIWSMKDYDNSTSEFNIASILDFSSVEPLPDLYSVINNCPINSYETSANTLDSPIPKRD